MIEAPSVRRPGAAHVLTLAGFLLCAAVAIGYGLWGLYGSGQRLMLLDAAGSADGSTAALDPVALDPAMSPMRAVLRASYAPVGLTRTPYRVELVGPSGESVWVHEGSLGSHDDQASTVWTTTSLGAFEVTRAGEYTLRVRFGGETQDVLHGATIELRRNVARIDGRIAWGFGLAGAALLAAHLVIARGRQSLYRSDVEQPRAAA